MRKYIVKFSDGRVRDVEVKAENVAHARMIARNKYGYCVVKAK